MNSPLEARNLFTVDKPLLTVTKPFLPPIEEFIPYLEKIWESGIITNNGPFHQQLEDALAEYLGVKHVSLFTNGTIALVTALQALRITGEVITTPYTFVATAHSLLWNNLTPVFADIDPKTCNLDPTAVERAITSKTTAVLPVHCYGNPCDTKAFQQIGDQYGLKIIYDAAHAFGVFDDGRALCSHGDLAILSFHATKIFNTFEGGAIISQDGRLKQRIDYLKNFGFANETTVVAAGINGKMSEINAAMGLLQLDYVNNNIRRRLKLVDRYKKLLDGIPGVAIVENRAANPNGAYMPIRVMPNYPIPRDGLYERLKASRIRARRYFYPCLSEMPMYRELPSSSDCGLHNAREISRQIICLPLYPEMSEEDVELVASLIAQY